MSTLQQLLIIVHVYGDLILADVLHSHRCPAKRFLLTLYTLPMVWDTLIAKVVYSPTGVGLRSLLTSYLVQSV